MDNRIIRTLGKSNQRKLREFKGVRTINQLKKLYPNARTNEQVYEIVKEEYNTQLNNRIKLTKKNITNIKSSLSREFLKLKQGKSSIKINLIPVHNFYNLKDFINDLLVRLDKYIPDKKLLLEINGVSYALGRNNRQRLVDLINNNMIQTQESTESDGLIVQEINVAEDMKISILEDTINNPDWFTYQRPTGGFFKYYNATKYDFSRYGIYKNENEYKDNSEMCLLLALRNGGLSDSKIEQLKHMIKNSHVPISQLKVVCEKLEIQIQLKREKANATLEIYGKEYSEIYKIALLDDHYFIHEQTENTSFSLTNYEDVKNNEKANTVCKIRSNSYFNYDKNKFINSFMMINILLENKDTLLSRIPFDHLTRTQYHKKIKDTIETLDYDESKLKKIEYEESTKEKENFTNIFFDFETRTIQNKHIPYLCCFVSDDGMSGSFIGEDCGLQLLKFLTNKIKTNILLIAHNATYDYQFLVRYLSKFSEITRGNRMISASGYFGKVKIGIKCSLHLIASSLKNFGKMFKLEQKKEVMPYDIYNMEEEYNKRYVSVDFVLDGVNENGKPFLKEEEKADFLKNIDEWKCSDNMYKNYDIIEYSRRYCMLDCIVLRDGYNTFRKWILSLDLPNGKSANLDINNILTCASLAHTYLLKSGCYDELYELSGIPQRFIQKTVVGGRTMMKNNTKQYINNGRKVSDFDGVSLYPSAMNRMDGFMKGKPKVLTTTDYNLIKNYTGYFVEIKVHSIPIKRSFPLMSEKNDEGVRVFSNNIKNTIFVDKIQLEDLIEFHNLQSCDFSIIRGYYFNDGFNTNIRDTINYLFNTRLLKKQEKNPSETIYKLIMNSAYGKSIMKEVLQETHIIENEHRYGVFVSRNYDTIESIVKIDNCEKWKVKTTASISQHSNIAHVGSSVLSWSKRIMNEVMCLAEDNKIDIFYQDTDSMHMYEDTIEKLGKLYKAKYNRDLIGEKLGQFHTDFDIKGCKNVYSNRLITLGKKSYCDELVGEDANGNKKIEYHIRMKGIPNSCIEYTVKQKGYKNVFELYEKLYKGEIIEFDLTEGKNKAIFRYGGNFSVRTETKFNRNVKFM